MRLIDLEPKFYCQGGEDVTGADGRQLEDRTGLGLTFRCPCGCASRCAIPFANPLDGGPQVGPQGWQRTGDTFETLTLSPSILRVGGCAWHGWIRNGNIEHA